MKLASRANWRHGPRPVSLHFRKILNRHFHRHIVRRDDASGPGSGLIAASFPFHTPTHKVSTLSSRSIVNQYALKKLTIDTSFWFLTAVNMKNVTPCSLV